MIKNKKIKVLIVSILCILTITIGLSYGYYLLNRVQENNNIAGSKCFNLEFTNEKNAISLDNMYPISDEEGRKLTPYSFTITNTCDMLAGYTVNMEMLEGTTLNSKYLDVMVNNEQIKLLTNYESTNTAITGSTESRILAKGTLAYNDSVDYTVRFWMDKDVEDTESMNKIFKSKIVISATPSSWNPKDVGYDTLHDAILANEYQTTPEDALKKIEAKGEPDLSQTSPIVNYKEAINENEFVEVSLTLPTEKVLEMSNVIGYNEKTIFPVLSTNYTLNSNTGKYSLVDSKYIDPTTIDFTSETYYTCATDSIIFSKDGTIQPYSIWTGCNQIYKIISATKSSSQKNNIDTYIYKYRAYKLTQTIFESDKSTKGLYISEDDYGNSIYYRGSVTNNYVKFADAYWRIIRINGDGTVRLLYDGLTANQNGDTGAKRYISFSSYNNPYNDNTYVGYMYGKVAASSYSEAHENLNDSKIKIALDNWYKNNIISKSLDMFIADSGFCNDRSLYTGDGYGMQATVYNSYSRIYDLLSPTFKCSNISNDLFTTRSASIGNKALTYSIGLITADEVMFSGLIKNTTINKLAFTYSNDIYWTMSPFRFTGASQADMLTIVEGYIHNWGRLDVNYAVRPVINLKSDVKITGGIGTTNDPYVIDTSK